MRIHKRLSSQISSPTTLHKLLIELKQAIDSKLFSNYAVLDNAAYFEGTVKQNLMLTLEKFPALVPGKAIRNIAAIIAQEYINERNAAS